MATSSTFDHWCSRFGCETPGTGADPVLMLRLGPMGSGKSTSIDRWISSPAAVPGDPAGPIASGLGMDVAKFASVDLDDIVTSSEVYKDGFARIEAGTLAGAERTKALGDLWWKAQVAVDGYAVVDKLVERLMFHKRHITTESTGTWLCPSRSRLLAAWRAGYNVVAAYPYVKYSSLKERVQLRAMAEGRDVPEDDLRKNYLAALKKVGSIRLFAERFVVLDNNVARGEDAPVLAEAAIGLFNKAYDTADCAHHAADNKRITRLMAEVEAEETDTEIRDVQLCFLEALRRRASMGSCSA